MTLQGSFLFCFEKKKSVDNKELLKHVSRDVTDSRSES